MWPIWPRVEDLEQEPLPQGLWKLQLFVHHNLYTCILHLSDLWSGVKKKMLKEKHQIYTFYHKIMSLLDKGHEIYNFLFEYAF